MKVVCDGVCERECVKLCVKDGVCERECVTTLCVKESVRQSCV